MAMIEYPAADAWKTFGEKVQQRRLELGLTQDEAAERGGVSGTTWRNIEKGNGTSYRALTLSGVCRALGWPPNAYSQILFTDDDVEEGVTVDVDAFVLAERMDFMEERQDDILARLERLEQTLNRSGTDRPSGGHGEPLADGDSPSGRRVPPSRGARRR